MPLKLVRERKVQCGYETSTYRVLGDMTLSWFLKLAFEFVYNRFSSA
jgi:hypothetical protein